MGIYTKYYKAAGITVQVISDFPITKNTFHPKFNFFEIHGPGKDNVVIRHHFSAPDHTITQHQKDKKTIIDDGTWKITVSDSIYLYQYNSKEDANFEYFVTAKFNAEHTMGNIFFSGISEQQYKTLQLASVTGLGTDQVLLSHLMVNRSGFIFHSNGVSQYGKSILFSGKSGAGKSTLSNMLQHHGASVFCDDRVIIQNSADQFIASGSWIHPGVTSDSNLTQKICAVFFIEQSKKNSIKPITNIVEKYHKMVQSLVKNFFIPSQWDITFELIDIFVKQVPFYTLKFNKTGEICDIVLDEVKNL